MLAARRQKFGEVTVNDDVMKQRQQKFGMVNVNDDMMKQRQQKFGVVEKTKPTFYTRQNRKRNGGHLNFPKRRRFYDCLLSTD